MFLDLNNSQQLRSEIGVIRLKFNMNFTTNSKNVTYL